MPHAGPRSRRALVFVTAFLVASISGALLAAAGDVAGPITNVAQGGVNNHDPYFQDFNSPRGQITLTGGNIVTGWRARRASSAAVPNSPDGADGLGHGTFFKVSSPTGAAVSSVVRPYLDINPTGTGDQNTPMLAPLSGGGFVIVWNSAQGPGDTPAADPFGGDCYGRVYDASGNAVSGTFKVNENDPTGTEDTQYPLAVVGMTGGGFAVAWADGNDNSGNTDDFFLRVYNASGVPQAASTRLGGAGHDAFFKDFNTFGGTEGLVALSNGNVAVAWAVRDQNNDGTGVSTDGGGGASYFQIFNATGGAVTAAISPYAASNPDGSGNQSQPVLIPLTGGGFAAAWNSNRNTNDAGFVDAGNGVNGTTGGDAYVRVFDNAGAGTSTTVRINDARTDDSEYPRDGVALSGGGFAIVWHEDDDATGNTDDFYARAFTAAGAAANASVMIAEASADALFDDYAQDRGLIALDDGGFVAAVRVRDSNNNGTGTSIDGAVGVGGFAATFRVFNADGTARTARVFPYFDVNADGSGAQNIPQLVAVGGGFAVAWNSQGDAIDVGGGDTYTRLYANAGTALHATVKVTDTEPTGTADDQSPSSMVRAAGNYIVLLRDENNNTGNRDDLFIRAFEVVAAAPEIVVEQPAGTNIADGGSKSFGSVNVGSNTSLTFTIRNTGASNLTGLTTTIGGTNPGDFTVTTAPTAPVAGGGSTTFVVQFTPGAPGARSATLQIASNDADENPFDIALSGTGVALPVLSINDVTVTEGNAGTVNAAFTVSLNIPALAGGVTFDIATQNDTAASGSDYVAQSLTGQTIAAGNSTYTFTVLVNGDSVDEANERFFVNVSNVSGATVSDAQGNGNVTDDDTAGITVTPTSGLVTTEAGGTATFTVVLDSQPTANVSIGLSSSDVTEGTVAPASLTFTSADWSTPKTVTLTGVDDGTVDGNVAYSILTAAATSTDANYSGRNAADVSATNNDNDVVGISVTPTSGLVTTEAGGTATFTVVLTSQPTANVTIALSSSDATEGTVATASLTFTTVDFGTPKTVTLTGVDDLVDDGDVAYTIVTAPATSADASYNNINPSDVAATNTDNDAAGITVTPTAGLVTTEAGGTATFTVVLTSEPTANVTVPVSSSDPTEGTVAPASLTFTNADWSTPKTVTLTGVDDAVDDGDIAYSVVTAPATSADPNYSGRNASDVAATNTDNDTAGITVTPTSGLVTTEAGGTTTFTVVLTSEPTANVSIGISSADSTEGTAAPASLTFTNVDWSTPKTVTVTGVDDAVDDGNVAYTIVTAAATSADPGYNGRNASDVAATNTDNDTAGIDVTPTSGLVTTEAGGTATFTVVLTSEPTANVTIPVASADTTEASAAPASLTFTSLDWNTPKTVTVTGVDDAIDDGDVAYTVVTAAATSADGVYNGMNAADVTATNTDNDTAGITVTPTSGLVTTEAGGTATFTIVLTSEPTANVSIGLSSSDNTEGTPAPASLTFTNADWSTPKTVTVTGVDDPAVDGDVAYTILTAAATSADAGYSGRDAADVSATNTDDDVAGVSVTPASGLVTTEAGGTATFTIVLTSQPSADVSIAVASSDPTEGSAAPASVTFTNADWSIAKTVTVTGVDDFVDDGDVAYTLITGPAMSTDPNYANVAVADVAATNTDDDTFGVVVAPTSGLVTTEAGGTATFTIVLASQPTADVTIALSSSDTTEATVAPASVTFTGADWNMPRTVTATGVDDLVDDGDVAYTIATAAATSADPSYAGLDASDVSATNTDDDAAGITVTPTAGLATTEAGGTATFTVVLTSQPTADVSVALSSDDATEGAVAPASVTFTSANWNTARTVTVTGADDAVDDGDIAYGIVTAAATSADPGYAGVDAADVSVTNVDDDTAGITVTPTTGLVTTEAGGTATFTVVLTSEPIAAVDIGLSSGDTTEGTVAPASLTFTSGDWNTPKTVTITGVDDFADDGDIAYTIVTAPATSQDASYASVDAANVDVSNVDDDAIGISATPANGLVTTEAGGTATFTVVLTSQPSADVVLSPSSGDTTEGTIAPATLTFTSADWNTPQTVTVTGVDDLSFDGNVAYVIALGNAASADPQYQGLAGGNVGATNTDDETDRYTGPTATGTGTATVVVSGGQCALDLSQTAFITTAGLRLPPFVTFPHGAVTLRAQGCAVGTTMTVTLTLPSLPAPYALYKLRTNVDPGSIPSTPAGVNTVSYTLVDGGPLDADGAANGVIVDPVALGQLEPTVIPTTDAWARIMMALLLAAFALVALRRRTAA